MSCVFVQFFGCAMMRQLVNYQASLHNLVRNNISVTKVNVEEVKQFV